jgi:hypothetical protein
VICFLSSFFSGCNPLAYACQRCDRCQSIEFSHTNTHKMITIPTRVVPRLATLARGQNATYAKRTLITLKDHKASPEHQPLKPKTAPTPHQYTAHATATGQGRNGLVTSDTLKLHFAPPKELGGSGDGQNPEQLFAMGYACTEPSLLSPLVFSLLTRGLGIPSPPTPSRLIPSVFPGRGPTGGEAHGTPGRG